VEISFSSVGRAFVFGTEGMRFYLI